MSQEFKRLYGIRWFEWFLMTLFRIFQTGINETSNKVGIINPFVDISTIIYIWFSQMDVLLLKTNSESISIKMITTLFLY